MTKEVIAYLHTHWDREWYREFEIFRLRLLRVFDNVLDLLTKGRIPSFYFDGQVAALEDYLEMRPEKEALVKSLIKSKKLFIGPFYCLVDEFLTDKTCFIKNLEIGMEKAINYGCTDFVGYLADTFGHSENIPDILREFGIDKCIVWRGCGDFPSEFKWCGMDTVNLVRGYFQDVFSLNCTIEEKADLLKKNLDMIAEKSGDCLLLPIGADHMGVPSDIDDQIIAINQILKDSYDIKLGSIFEYFKKVENNFNNFEINTELRDNSKTFILQGCYSSRLDLKRYNTICSYKLDLVVRFVNYVAKHRVEIVEKYEKVINYAYKMLLQNQAHDSICGCSTDLVHQENIIRYKKILQICETIIDELKLLIEFKDGMILNLSEEDFSGIVEFKTTKNLKEYACVLKEKSFDRELLTDVYRVPVTEDYQNIYTYLGNVEHLKPYELAYILPNDKKDGIQLTNTYIGNHNINLKVENNKIFVNDIMVKIVDFVDNGDSYNFGPNEIDDGFELKLIKTRVELNSQNRAILRLDFESLFDIVTLYASLDLNSEFLKFEYKWNNTRKNHLLVVEFELKSDIKTVYSEDLNQMIKREFNSKYDIRKNLPKQRGLEAKTNTAPMQRGLLIDEKDNNIGIITKGLTQYEIFENKLRIPILRSTGIISNPLNSSRTTPAGPPIETLDLQMIGECVAEMNVFFGSQNTFDKVMNAVYNYIIV